MLLPRQCGFNPWPRGIGEDYLWKSHQRCNAWNARFAMVEYLIEFVHPSDSSGLPPSFIEGKKPRNCKSADVDVRDYTKAEEIAKRFSTWTWPRPSRKSNEVLVFLKGVQEMHCGTARPCWKTTILTCNRKAVTSKQCTVTLYLCIYIYTHIPLYALYCVCDMGTII